ncbi:hypothetical protein D3C84_1088650 [compost metagenome]
MSEVVDSKLALQSLLGIHHISFCPAPLSAFGIAENELPKLFKGCWINVELCWLRLT